MIFVVVVPEQVCQELNQIFGYYEERQAGLGVRFLDDWEQTMEHLEKRPLIHQVQFKKFRCVKFNSFPFLIIYKVEKEIILIYKLIHARRNPARRYMA